MAYQSKYTGLQIDDILDSVEWKQGKIEDLASIRAGAQKGATALQSYTEKYTGTVTGIKINGVVKSGSGVIDLGTISTDISGKQDKLVDGVNIATINGQSLTEGGDLTIEGGTKVYEWFYDGESESVTLSQEEYDNIVEADIVVVNLGGLMSCVVSKSGKEFSEAAGGYFLVGQVDMQGNKMYVHIIISISTKLATITLEQQEIPTKTSQLENDNNFITPEDVAAVALSGSYNDLHDAPTIPSAVTESTVSGWGFTKNTGTYSKPSGGIPKSDLASAVQTSLGKADTAIQSTSFGELTDLAVVKGFESAQNGTVYALPDCDTGDEDDVLLSRSSVKTINGQSIVGRGDIEISGGSGGGEDIRYFTEFTMDDFLNINNYDNNNLIAAAINNKIICIPAYDSTRGTGYYIPSYYCNVYEGDVSLTINILTNGIEYSLEYLSNYNHFEINSIAYKTAIEYLYDTELSVECKDNILYIAQEELSSLSVYENLSLDLGSTIRFVTSEDFVLTMPENTLWANGVMPEIEPHVQYELSLTMDNNYSFLAVLTPFKSVE